MASSQLPAKEYVAFLIAISSFFGIFGAASSTVPSTVYIALLSNKSNSQEWRAFQLAINHVNSKGSLLPNTTIKAFEGEVNQDNILEYAKNISQVNIVSLLLFSKTTVTHKALSTMLRIPLVTTHIESSLPGGAKQFRYGVRMGPSSQDMAAAILGIITHYEWTSLLVLYDVRWRHLAHDFVSQLPPKMKVSKIALELDHHRNTEKLCEETKRKLTGFNDAHLEAFVLFLENHWVENIINQVHCSCSLKVEKPHNWLLVDPISSSDMEVQSSQVVVGFQPHKSSSHVTELLKTELLPSKKIKDSSFLIYDAVWTIAHALHTVISTGMWKNASYDGLDLSKNGETMLQYLKKVGNKEP